MLDILIVPLIAQVPALNIVFLEAIFPTRGKVSDLLRYWGGGGGSSTLPAPPLQDAILTGEFMN